MDDQPLPLLEHELRRLVVLKLGDSWRQDLDERELRSARKLATTDRDKRQGRDAADSNLLDYPSFPRLLQIFEDHSQQLLSVLGETNIVTAFFRVLERYRNPEAHGRELLRFEREHVSSITTEFVNNIGRYLSMNQSAESFYPVIGSATDESGRLGMQGGTLHSLPLGSPPPPRLSAGVGMTFSCRAIDPLGRTLYWSINSGIRAGSHTEEFEYDFNDASPSTESEEAIQIVWKPSPHLFGELVTVTIRVRSASKYHQHNQYYPGREFDDAVSFPYSINPPME